LGADSTELVGWGKRSGILIPRFSRRACSVTLES
jgi:hypothetical protein